MAWISLSSFILWISHEIIANDKHRIWSTTFAIRRAYWTWEHCSFQLRQWARRTCRWVSKSPRAALVVLFLLAFHSCNPIHICTTTYIFVNYSCTFGIVLHYDQCCSSCMSAQRSSFCLAAKTGPTMNRNRRRTELRRKPQKLSLARRRPQNIQHQVGSKFALTR